MDAKGIGFEWSEYLRFWHLAYLLKIVKIPFSEFLRAQASKSKIYVVLCSEDISKIKGIRKKIVCLAIQKFL